MAQLKVSELFYSIQGEGRYMGVPSVFLRVFGCNFTCGGFGMPRGQLSYERNEIQAEKFTDYKTLPLVSTGCDSYASWDPRFKNLSPVLSTDSIVTKILDLLPTGNWEDEHLVITGGEPLLGWQRSYPDLLDHADMLKLKEITFETNGTQHLTEDFSKYLTHWVLSRGWSTTLSWGMQNRRTKGEITFSVSPKLSSSGEKYEDAIKPEVVVNYQHVGIVYLKFVVSDDKDMEEIDHVVHEYRKEGYRGVVYLMPCGGTESLYLKHNKKIAKLAMKKGFRYSDRLQIPLFKNEWGT